MANTTTEDVTQVDTVETTVAPPRKTSTPQSNSSTHGQTTPKRIFTPTTPIPVISPKTEPPTTSRLKPTLSSTKFSHRDKGDLSEETTETSLPSPAPSTTERRMSNVNISITSSPVVTEDVQSEPSFQITTVHRPHLIVTHATESPSTVKTTVRILSSTKSTPIQSPSNLDSDIATTTESNSTYALNTTVVPTVHHTGNSIAIILPVVLCLILLCLGIGLIIRRCRKGRAGLKIRYCYVNVVFYLLPGIRSTNTSSLLAEVDTNVLTPRSATNRLAVALPVIIGGGALVALLFFSIWWKTRRKGSSRPTMSDGVTVTDQKNLRLNGAYTSLPSPGTPSPQTGRFEQLYAKAEKRDKKPGTYFGDEEYMITLADLDAIQVPPPSDDESEEEQRPNSFSSNDTDCGETTMVENDLYESAPPGASDHYADPWTSIYEEPGEPSTNVVGQVTESSADSEVPYIDTLDTDPITAIYEDPGDPPPPAIPNRPAYYNRPPAVLPPRLAPDAALSNLEAVAGPSSENYLRPSCHRHVPPRQRKHDYDPVYVPRSDASAMANRLDKTGYVTSRRQRTMPVNPYEEVQYYSALDCRRQPNNVSSRQDYGASASPPRLRPVSSIRNSSAAPIIPPRRGTTQEVVTPNTDVVIPQPPENEFTDSEPINETICFPGRGNEENGDINNRHSMTEELYEPVEYSGKQ